MAIIYTHEATQQPVTKEAWRWVAVYNDKTRFYQFEVTNNGALFHRSAEINAGELNELLLEHDIYPPITIKFPKGATVVHFYRHRTMQEIVMQGTPGEHMQREWKLKTWVIGFRLGGNYWLAYADELGHVLFSNDDKLFQDKILPEEIR